jgi:hypothetical protein
VWAYVAIFLYGLIFSRKCILWPRSRARDYYMAEPSIRISLRLLLSTAELGTESVVELWIGPATELEDISQHSWELPHGGAMGSYPR